MPGTVVRSACHGASAVVLLVAAGCGAEENALLVPAPAPDPEQVTVAGVIDGDTFVATDGRTIRVLGIDACEPGTPGGDQARRAAEELFAGPDAHPVTLIGQAGVVTNPGGMLLRYVQVRGTDYGEQVVGYDHTGVSTSPGASAAYLDRLRSIATRNSVHDPPVDKACDGP